jgi:hypothetical protein
MVKGALNTEAVKDKDNLVAGFEIKGLLCRRKPRLAAKKLTNGS